MKRTLSMAIFFFLFAGLMVGMLADQSDAKTIDLKFATFFPPSTICRWMYGNPGVKNSMNSPMDRSKSPCSPVAPLENPATTIHW